MMSNTLKELNVRKKALANIKGGASADGSNIKQFEPPAKVPLPPPKVVTIETVADKTKTIAALQAQIANRLSKLTVPAPVGMVVAQPAAIDRPTAVILDDKGRTVDDKGQEIQLGHFAPTLKANLRAKKRDELTQNLKAGDTLELQDQVSHVIPCIVTFSYLPIWIDSKSIVWSLDLQTLNCVVDSNILPVVFLGH